MREYIQVKQEGRTSSRKYRIRGRFYSTRIVNSVERVADLQKKTLDVAAEQTAEWIGAWKKAFSYFPVTPATFFFDIAGQAVQTAIENQKSAIDLVVEQTEAATEIAKVRADAYSKIAAGVGTSVRKSVERSVEAQKKVLELASAAEQSRSLSPPRSSSARRPGPATAILDTFQRGADTVIEAQKSFLDMASQPFVNTARTNVTRVQGEAVARMMQPGVKQSPLRELSLCIVVLKGVLKWLTTQPAMLSRSIRWNPGGECATSIWTPGARLWSIW